ncbi:hypothetical protein D3C86_1875580 [compost metagenome]
MTFSAFEFAICNDWIASCSCVCNALSRVEASFMSASTRRPMPLSMLSISVFAKSVCMLIRVFTAPRVAPPEMTFCSIASTPDR